MLVVVIIIGILSGLAYSSFMDIIFSNRARETAQTMRTFAERALAEGKRQNVVVELSLADGDKSMRAAFEDDNGDEISNISQPLSDGFKGDNSTSISEAGTSRFSNDAVKSKKIIGISGITESGHFVACGARGYCGAAVKIKEKNSFTAWVKRGKTSWEEL